jgi:murein DD-endopeptidase MepM/ murein hydrolase activator NlpD
MNAGVCRRRLVVLAGTVAVVAVACLVLPGVASAWSWPVDGTVLRAFKHGNDPYAGGQHRGIDIAGADGEGVRAPIGGSVTFVGSVPTSGRTISILTEDGYSVTLSHLGAAQVSKGDSVVEGSVIASVGSSGTPEHTETYLHLGVRVEAEEQGYVDPLGFLPPREAAPPPPSEPAAVVEPAVAPEPVTAGPAPQPPAGLL